MRIKKRIVDCITWLFSGYWEYIRLPKRTMSNKAVVYASDRLPTVVGDYNIKYKDGTCAILFYGGVDSGTWTKCVEYWIDKKKTI